jgi:hypothetical protein
MEAAYQLMQYYNPEDLHMNPHKDENLKCHVDSEAFWQWHATLRLAGLLDVVHHSVFQKLENTTFWKLDLFPSSGERETPTLLGPLERANLNPVTEVSSFLGTQQSRLLPITLGGK